MGWLLCGWKNYGILCFCTDLKDCRLDRLLDSKQMKILLSHLLWKNYLFFCLLGFLLHGRNLVILESCFRICFESLYYLEMALACHILFDWLLLLNFIYLWVLNYLLNLVYFRRFIFYLLTLVLITFKDFFLAFFQVFYSNLLYFL